MKVGIKSLIYSLIIILVTFILPTFNVFIRTNSYYINIVVWFLLFLSSVLAVREINTSVNARKSIGKTTLILTVGYLILYFFLGLVTGYAENPLFTGLINFIRNTVFILLPFIFRELLRSKLIQNANSRSQYILITIAFILSEFEINTFFNLGGGEATFKYIFGPILNNILENSLLSYLAYVGGKHCTLMYIIPIKLKNIIIPILPDLDWFVSGIASIIFAVVALTILANEYNNRVSRDRVKRKSDKTTVIVLIIGIFIVSFVVGFFKYQPVAVLSNSMKPIFGRGDVVLLKRLNKKDKEELKVGDVIRYKLDGFDVLHRILEIKEDKKGVYYITKGDNNSAPDNEIVYQDQVVSQIMFSVPYLGYPSVWLYQAMNSGTEVAIEKGE